MIKIILPILCLIFITGCEAKTNKQEKATIKMSIEVIPESDTSYSISWHDTIGQAEGYTLINRPIEIWCILKDAKDTVGHYTGLSTASNFTYFSTYDSVITAIFKIGSNSFSNGDLIQNEDKIIEFKPILLNLNTDLRKKLEIILKEK